MKVLIIKLSSLGDIIHTLPGVYDAQDNNIDMHWLVDSTFSDILKIANNVTIHKLSLRKLKANYLSLDAWGNFLSDLKKLRKYEFDLIIDVQGLLKSSLVGSFLKGKLVGFSKHSIREKLAHGLYDRSYVTNKTHAILKNKQLLAKALDYEYNQKVNYPYKLPKNVPQIYIIHGASKSAKRWPIKNWCLLVNIFKENNLDYKIIYGSDSEYKDSLLIDKDNIHSRETLDKLAYTLSGAKLAICVDTGLAHLCSSLKIKTLVLYGPTDPSKIGVYSLSTHIKRDRLEDIQVNQVWHETLKILAKS